MLKLRTLECVPFLKDAYVGSGPSLLIESPDSMITRNTHLCRDISLLSQL